MIKEEKTQEIIRLYNLGKSSKTVGDIVGISATQVRRILKKSGIESHSIKTNEIIEKEIIDLYIKNNLSSEKIAEKLNICSTTICRILKRNNIDLKGAVKFNRKYNINESFLDVIDTQEKAYFLGFMFADGNVHSKSSEIKICLHNKDIHILELFSNIFYGFKHLIYEKEGKYVTFLIWSAKLKKKLIEYGCVPAKTFKISMPVSIPEPLMSHFFRGLYDGDGCINFNGNKLRIILTGYSRFLEEIKCYLQTTLNITPIIAQTKKLKNVSDLSILRHEDGLMFLDWLYKDSTIYLNRKFEKYQVVKEFFKDKYVRKHQ